MQACIFVVGDSRAKGLCHVLTKDLDKGVRVVDVARGGATIDDIYSSITSSTKSCTEYHHHKCVVVLLGGICSLTRRARTRAGYEISYDPAQSDQRITNLEHKLKDICQYTEGRGIHTVCCSIYPASLLRAREFNIQEGRLDPIRSTYSEDILLTHQDSLETAIQTVNDRVKQELTDLNYPLVTWVNLHKELTDRSKKAVGSAKNKKKRVLKWKYINLYDGVHPNQSLKKIIGEKILHTCQRVILPAITQDTASSQSDNDDGGRSRLQRKDTGNFKRKTQGRDEHDPKHKKY